MFVAAHKHGSSPTLQIVERLLITHCTRSKYGECHFNSWHAFRSRTKSCHLQVLKRVKINRAAYSNSVWEKVFQRYKQMFGASFRKPQAGGGAYTRTFTHTHTHTRIHTNILIYTHIYNICVHALTNCLQRTHLSILKMKRKNNCC